MMPLWRGALVVGVLLIVVAMPIVCYRMVYAHDKRLREVIPGHIYRSGQLTAEGFADVQRRLGIKTIVNLQDEDYGIDPDLPLSFWNWHTIKESDLCRQLGIRFVVIKPDLVSRKLTPEQRPHAIDQLLDLLDDESNYPVLLHCKAGLHRTGVMSAVVRMEYQGWSPAQAYQELKAHGFGDWVCTSANDYVSQYVLSYRPGLRAGGTHRASR